MACIQAFHYYLHGRYFILESDHAPLKYVLSHAQKGRVQNTRLERWKLALQGLDMTVKYVSRQVNRLADLLSRSPRQVDWKDFQRDAMLDDPDIGIGISALFSGTTDTRKASGKTPEREAANRASGTPVGPIDSANHTAGAAGESSCDLPTLQRADPFWQPLIEILEGKPIKGKRRLWKYLPDYHLDRKGVLFYQPAESPEPRAVVPQTLIPQLIAENHSHPMAGHFHDRSVTERLKRRFSGPLCRRTSRNFVKVASNVIALRPTAGTSQPDSEPPHPHTDRGRQCTRI